MRREVDIPRLLSELGIEWKRQGNRLVAKCPFHEDKSPSWSIVNAPGKRSHGSHHCFSCKSGGGPWELVAQVKSISLEKAAHFVKALDAGQSIAVPTIRVVMPAEHGDCEIPAGVVVPIYRDDWFPPALSYLISRGVTWDQIQRWGIGYAVTGRLSFRIVVPVVTMERLVSWTARSFLPKSSGKIRYLTASSKDRASPSVAIFGEPRWEGTDTVTVAEGVWSALALERAQAPNPCAILGSNLTPAKVALLGQFQRIVMATDPDHAGERAYKDAVRAFGQSRVIRARFSQSPDDCDPAELRAHFEVSDR